MGAVRQAGRVFVAPQATLNDPGRDIMLSRRENAAARGRKDGADGTWREGILLAMHEKA